MDLFGVLTFITACAALIAASLGVFWYAQDRKDIREGILNAAEAISSAKTTYTPQYVENRLEKALDYASDKYLPVVGDVIDARLDAFKQDMLQEVDARAAAFIPRLEEYGNNLLTAGVGGIQEVMTNLASGVASQYASQVGQAGGARMKEKAELKAQMGFKNAALKDIAGTIIGQGDPLKAKAIEIGLERAEEFGIEPEQALEIGTALMQKFNLGGNGGPTPPSKAAAPSTGRWGN